MEHREVQDEGLIERYVTGRLADAERAAFEEHMVECPDCIQEAAWAEDFRGALRQAEGPPGAAARPKAAPPRSRGPVAWALAAGLAGAALPSLLFVVTTRGLRQDLARSSEESTRWRQRYEEEQRRAALPTPAPGEANVATVMLSAARGEAGPGASLALPPGGRWVVILAELEPDPAYLSYRGRIESAGRVRWTGSGLRPDANGLLSILLPAGQLERGAHLLVVDGVTSDGRTVVAGRYPFRVAELPVAPR